MAGALLDAQQFVAADRAPREVCLDPPLGNSHHLRDGSRTPQRRTKIALVNPRSVRSALRSFAMLLASAHGSRGNGCPEVDVLHSACRQRRTKGIEQGRMDMSASDTAMVTCAAGAAADVQGRFGVATLRHVGPARKPPAGARRRRRSVAGL